MTGPSSDSTNAVPWRRGDTWVLAALLLVFGLYYWRLQFREHPYTYDVTAYLAGAKSLAAGQGYRFIDHVGQPKIGLYPPLHSLVLSLAFRINPEFPANLPWVNGIMIAEALLVLAACLVLLRQHGIPRWISALAVATVGTSPMWGMWLFIICSDILFIALCLWLLIAWRGRREPASTATWLGTGCVLGLAYLTRTAALALIAGVGLIALWQWKQGRRQAMLAYCLPVLAALGTWKWLAHGAAGYAAIWSVWIERLGGVPGYLKLLGKNLVYTLGGNSLAEIFCPLYVRIPAVAERLGRPLLAITGWFCALPFLWLLWAAGRGCSRSRSAMQWSVALIGGLYVLEVLVVPFSAWFFSRYLFLLWPVFFIWVWRGLPSLTLARQELIVGAVLGTMLAANLWLTHRTWRFEKEEPQVLAEFNEAMGWLKKNSDSRDLVAIDWSLPTTQLHATLQRPLIADYLVNPSFRESPVTHEAQGRPPAAYLITTLWAPRTNAPPGLLTPVFASSRGYYLLFRVDPERERQYQLELYGTPPPR